MTEHTFSPVDNHLMTAGSRRLSEPKLYRDQSYWLESSAATQGRTCLMTDIDGTAIKLTPSAYNIRTKAHEYGGGSYCFAGNFVVFVNADDQCIYRQSIIDNSVQQLTYFEYERPADLAFDPHHRRILCVIEEHNDTIEPENRIVAIDFETGAMETLVEGEHFYSNPQISPCGRYLSWLSWNHPDMPWDHTRCWLAELDAHGFTGKQRCVAGRDLEESVFQPQWGPDGRLYIISDRSGWWNLYGFKNQKLTPLLPMNADCGVPQWQFGMSTYAFTDTEILVLASQEGRWTLWRRPLDWSLSADKAKHVVLSFSDLHAIHAQSNSALLIAAESNDAPAIVRIDLTSTTTDPEIQKLRRSLEHNLSKEEISRAEAFDFHTGCPNQTLSHGFFYRPTLRPTDAKGPPPLLVMCHGGPTGATETGLNPKIQYWTSRGFAVADINYRGSTGYGRTYREAINGKWGVVDLEDVCCAVNHLAQKGLIDPTQCAIRGSSAGGFTVLSALTFTNIFKVGVSLYGIGDLAVLAKDTHKFESRYLDRLVGTWPEAKAIYRARSPRWHADKLNCPVLFLQGLDDAVVPANQALDMVQAMTQQGVSASLITFAGEGHGFRDPSTVIRCLDAEFSFYRQYFGEAICAQ